MPADVQKSNRVHKPSEKAIHGRRDLTWKSKCSKAHEGRTSKTKKQKCSKSSEDVSESSRQSEEETDKDTLHCHKGKSRAIHQSVTPGQSVASEVEEVVASAKDNDIVELLSIDTRHSSEYGDVSSHSMSIL